MSYSVTFLNQSINVRYSRRRETWDYVHKTAANETNTVSFGLDGTDGLVDLILFEIGCMRAMQNLDHKDVKIVVDMNTAYKKMVFDITPEGTNLPYMRKDEDDEKKAIDDSKEESDEEEESDDDEMEIYEELLHIFMALEPTMVKTEGKR